MESKIKFLFYNLVKFVYLNFISLLHFKKSFKKETIPLTNANIEYPFPPRTLIIENSMWGLDKIFKINFYNLHLIIEHGYFWGDYLPKNYSSKFQVIAPCNRRAKYLSKKKIPVKQLDYIDSCRICNTTLSNVKKNKYILIFPPHSTKTKKRSARIENLLDEILSKYNCNIVICSFYLDFEYYLDYESDRISVTSCGNRYDPKFLERLKALIIAASKIYTCIPGTHVLYSAMLEKDIIMPEKTAIEELIMDEKRMRREDKLVSKISQNEEILTLKAILCGEFPNKIKMIKEFYDGKN